MMQICTSHQAKISTPEYVYTQEYYVFVLYDRSYEWQCGSDMYHVRLWTGARDARETSVTGPLRRQSSNLGPEGIDLSTLVDKDEEKEKEKLPKPPR